jgi:hypothetical protein
MPDLKTDVIVGSSRPHHDHAVALRFGQLESWAVDVQAIRAKVAV